MTAQSVTPLIQKLGIKEDFKILFIDAPGNYLSLLGKLPNRIKFAGKEESNTDFVHLFCYDDSGFSAKLRAQKNRIAQNGMIWVSWQKKKSGQKGHLNENTIRNEALKTGMVDIKVCAVDETWSGLKLVIRKENREG